MKTILKLLFVPILLLTMYSCAKKTTSIPTPVQVTTPEVEKPIVDLNCMTFSNLNVGDRETAETAYVLYKDELKLKNYTAAQILWKKAFYLAPAANGRVKYQYDDGIKIYQSLYKKTDNVNLKESYIDTIMSIYKRRLECVKDTSYVLGRMAYDYYYTFPGTKSNDEIYNLLIQALVKSGQKADYFIINPLTQLLIEQYQQEKIDKATAKKYTFKILEVVKYGNANCKRNCKAWGIVRDYAPLRLEAFEALTDFYDCSYYIDHYYHEYEANPTDCDIISQTISKLRRGKCNTEDEKLKTLYAAKTQHCKVVVAKTGPCRSGYTAYTDGKYKEAINSFESCIASISDNSKKAKYQLLIAKIYYRDLKNFSKAKQYALMAAATRPHWGEPFMLIGRLYASSGPLCGTGTGFESQKVTWPAIDKWKYAKKIDPSTTKDANKLINTYKKYMPSKEDLFLRELKLGAKFKVGCWINEHTIVRSAD